MATANDTRFSDLKTRLAALNCELLEEEGDHAERYVILDKAKGLIVSNGATLEDQYDWLETEEDVRNDTREVRADAIAADFNCPPVAKSYERFLSLIVIAGMGDRFKAMDIRKAKGIEAAVAFLGDCKLTEETPPSDSPPYETTAWRRERITKECDADAAIHEAEGVLWSVHGLAEILTLDDVRDDSNGVLSIGKSIVDQTERVLEFLDRAGGWDKP